MNNQQKIELAKFVLHGIATLKFDSEPSDLFYVTHADLVLNKIQELEQAQQEKARTDEVERLISSITNSVNLGRNQGKTPPQSKNTLECVCGATFDTNQQDNGHICGVCYVVCCPECLKEDFGVCIPCRAGGKTKIFKTDKNGKWFSSGDTLRNESSLITSVKILQINEKYIVFHSTENNNPSHGCVEIQDFIDAGWIVHDRVKGYSRGPKSGEHLDICKFFQATAIGGRVCQDCSHNNDTNTDQQWVICKLYNEENKDGK